MTRHWSDHEGPHTLRLGRKHSLTRYRQEGVIYLDKTLTDHMPTYPSYISDGTKWIGLGNLSKGTLPLEFKSTYETTKKDFTVTMMATDGVSVLTSFDVEYGKTIAFPNSINMKTKNIKKTAILLGVLALSSCSVVYTKAIDLETANKLVAAALNEQTNYKVESVAYSLKSEIKEYILDENSQEKVIKKSNLEVTYKAPYLISDETTVYALHYKSTIDYVLNDDLDNRKEVRVSEYINPNDRTQRHSGTKLIEFKDVSLTYALSFLLDGRKLLQGLRLYPFSVSSFFSSLTNLEKKFVRKERRAPIPHP